MRPDNTPVHVYYRNIAAFSVAIMMGQVRGAGVVVLGAVGGQVGAWCSACLHRPAVEAPSPPEVVAHMRGRGA